MDITAAPISMGRLETFVGDDEYQIWSRFKTNLSLQNPQQPSQGMMGGTNVGTSHRKPSFRELSADMHEFCTNPIGGGRRVSLLRACLCIKLVLNQAAVALILNFMASRK